MSNLIITTLAMGLQDKPGPAGTAPIGGIYFRTNPAQPGLLLTESFFSSRQTRPSRGCS